MRTKVIRVPKHGSMIAGAFITALLAVGMIANGAVANASGNSSTDKHANTSSVKASENSSHFKRADVAPVKVSGNSSKVKKSVVAPVKAPGNNGTLKIHELGTPSGTENTQPHVCNFNGEGFGLDAGQTGYLKFDVQGGDGPTGVAPLNAFAFGPANVSGYFATQYYHLANGHYKATLYGKQLPTGELTDIKAKSKNFKVKCGPETPPTTTTTTPPVTTTTTTPPVTTTTTTPPVTTTTTKQPTTTTTTTKPPVTTTTHTTPAVPNAPSTLPPTTPLAVTGFPVVPTVILALSLLLIGLGLIRYSLLGRPSGKYAANRS